MIKVVGLALWPTARALRVRTLVAVSVVGVTPTAVTLARDGTDLGGALVAGALFGAAAAACASDDDAAGTIEAVPTGALTRWGLRLAIVGVAVIAGWVGAVALGQAADVLPSVAWRSLGAVVLASSGVAVAAAETARVTHDLRRPSPAGLAAGLLVPLLITMLSIRFHGLPMVTDDPNHHRWLWVSALAWAAALWQLRDPASRFLRRAV